MPRAFSRAFPRAGNNMAASMAMIAMTTRIGNRAFQKKDLITMGENIQKQNPGMLWSGQSVSVSVMLQYLKRLLEEDKDKWRLNYVWTYPGLNLNSDMLSIMRLCWHCSMVRPLETTAVFDGVMQKRFFDNGDVIVGGYNAGNSDFAGEDLAYGGFTISFHINYIRLNFCEKRQGQDFFTIYYHTPRPAQGVLLQMVRTLDAIIHDPDPTKDDRAKLVLEALCRQLMHELSTQPDEATESHPSLATCIKTFIDHNYQHPINCSSISDAVGINRGYASELFHKKYHITMEKYMLKLRLEAAKYLLKSQRRLRIEDIAHACAFSTSGYFIRVFRKHVGKTPNAYRNT